MPSRTYAGNYIGRSDIYVPAGEWPDKASNAVILFF